MRKLLAIATMAITMTMANAMAVLPKGDDAVAILKRVQISDIAFNAVRNADGAVQLVLVAGDTGCYYADYFQTIMMNKADDIVFLHELGHAVDHHKNVDGDRRYLVRELPNNKKLKFALEQIQKYPEQNRVVSDIISSMSRGQLNEYLYYVHPVEYWERDEWQTQARENYANIFQIIASSDEYQIKMLNYLFPGLVDEFIANEMQ